MPKRIMIVDDAAFMRVSFKNMLTKNGFTVVGEAENGKVARQKFKDLAPDIVTKDIPMSEMDGLASLKQILAINPAACWSSASKLSRSAANGPP